MPTRVRISSPARRNAEGSPLHKKILEDFGSYENWEKDFRGVGGMRGIGWVILYYDKVGKKLFNTWINEHDVGHLSGCVPLLVMDVFEHAFMLEYGKRPDYIDAFMKAADWEAVGKRFGQESEIMQPGKEVLVFL